MSTPTKDESGWQAIERIVAERDALLAENTRLYDLGWADCRKREVEPLREENTRLREALREISEGRGRFSLDNFQHAKNTIEDMKELAVAALGESR